MRASFSLRWIILLVVAALVISLPAAAENFIPDPGFDDPTMPQWPAETAFDHDWSWDSFDIDESGDSGSGRFEHLFPASSQYTTVVYGECINGIDDRDLYDMGVMTYYPMGETVTGTVEAYVQLVFYDGADCAGPSGNVNSSHLIVNLDPDTWNLSSASGFSPISGTESVRFVLSITKKNSTFDETVYFDDAYLIRLPLFTDDFETSDTNNWSQTVQ